MKVTFLGTGGTMPSAARGAAAHAVWVKGETLLLDCGEGTQRQLRRSSVRFFATRIFLSHLHLDHIWGLPPYLGTMAILGRTEPLHLYVPVGAKPFVQSLVASAGRLPYPVILDELQDGGVVPGEGFRVTAARVQHDGYSLGFRIEEDPRPGKIDVERARALGIQPGPLIGRLQREGRLQVGGRTVRLEDIAGPPRPGRVVVYSGDTRPCRATVQLARGADLLLHDSAFTCETHDEAVAREHSTSAEAAAVARDAGVKRLALVHISHRHQESAELERMLREARQVFPETFLPRDLDEVEVPLTP